LRLVIDDRGEFEITSLTEDTVFPASDTIDFERDIAHPPRGNLRLT